MPIAAVSHSVAAVVRPRTFIPWLMIAPAPRKPMPVTICAAIRVGSARTTFVPLTRKLSNPYADTTVKSAEPSETSMCVRKPASWSRISRSIPIAPPRPAASASRPAVSQCERCGMLLARSTDRLFLIPLQVLDAGGGEIQQLIEAFALERNLLGSGLHLDEAAVTRHDDVHVDVRVRVLRVVEIQQGDTVDDADRDSCDRTVERLRQAEAVERALRGDVRARDRRTPRAAVGLQHVAIQVHRALAERLEVDDTAQRPADQALDLDRAPALLAARGLAVGALARRGGEQRVLGRHPAAARAVEPARNAFLNGRGAQDPRLSLRPEHDTVRLLEEARVRDDRAQLVGLASVVAAHAAASKTATSTRSTSPSGNWRKRSPTERNSSGSPVVRKRYVPSRSRSLSKPWRASVSATSRAVSSAENTSVTSRPKVRWKIGRRSG